MVARSPCPLSFPQSPNAPGPLMAATLDRTRNPGAELVIQSTGPSNQPTQVGWAQLLANGPIGGFAVFSQAIGNAVQDAEVPLANRNASAYVVPFDNTNGSATGVALANNSTSSAVFTTTIRRRHRYSAPVGHALSWSHGSHIFQPNGPVCLGDGAAPRNHAIYIADPRPNQRARPEVQRPLAPSARSRCSVSRN